MGRDDLDHPDRFGARLRHWGSIDPGSGKEISPGDSGCQRPVLAGTKLGSLEYSSATGKLWSRGNHPDSTAAIFWPLDIFWHDFSNCRKPAFGAKRCGPNVENQWH